MIPVLSCPSSPAADGPVSNYAGVHHHVEAPIDADNSGVLFLNSKLSFEDLRDGAAYTLFIGEKRTGYVEDLGWMSGTSATLRNTGTPLNGLFPANQSVPAASRGVPAPGYDLRHAPLDRKRRRRLRRRPAFPSPSPRKTPRRSRRRSVHQSRRQPRRPAVRRRIRQPPSTAASSSPSATAPCDSLAIRSASRLSSNSPTARTASCRRTTTIER